jgi:ABC-type multidrug transport system ATPase subunit
MSADMIDMVDTSPRNSTGGQPNSATTTNTGKNETSVDVLPPPRNNYATNNVTEKALFQVWLLLQKRMSELKQQPMELLKMQVGPWLFFILVILFYVQFEDFFTFGILAYGTFETYLIPPAFWIIILKTVTYAMHEKSSKIKESMRMMGLMDASYYISLFVSEGMLGGFLLSMSTSLYTFYPNFFNDAEYSDVLGLFIMFCLAAVPFALFWCSFFDSAQTASQAMLLVLLGAYALFAGVLVTSKGTLSNQLWACVLPPLAFQVGCNALSNPPTDRNNVTITANANNPSMTAITTILFVDIFLYTLLAWYFSQVWPSAHSVGKHPLFFAQAEYWKPKKYGEGVSPEVGGGSVDNPTMRESIPHDKDIPVEAVNETFVGRPTVVLRKLRKTFGMQVAVNDLSFKMYENQIFALLGHNGAGKTTTINVLTGSLPCDYNGRDSGAFIHGHSIHSGMDEIRKSMGVCPQHDVLFDNLSVFETIVFFSQLKGFERAEAVAEATHLCRLFHLERRMNHTGSELSGGQKRKLSVAIAICGGSRFVILDEPTAGMDPLARRELWDLLSSLRKGRTILLTTHYMDECNVLADRTAIINLGGLACMGSNGYLKSKLGAGYRLVFDVHASRSPAQARALTKKVLGDIPGATMKDEIGGNSYAVDDEDEEKMPPSSPSRSSASSTIAATEEEEEVSRHKRAALADRSVVYCLPFDQAPKFGPFLQSLGTPEEQMQRYGVSNYGVNISDLEEVFLSVGSDASVTPEPIAPDTAGIGGNTIYSPTMPMQLVAVAMRRLFCALHDFITIPMVLLPTAGAVGASIIATADLTLIAGSDPTSVAINAILVGFCTSCVYFGSYLAIPGLIGEFLIKERENRLRNLLTVMGCDFRAYWLGSFVGDVALLFVPTVALFVSWFAAGMDNYYSSSNGAAFFVILLFTAQLIAFAYLWSFIFSSPKACAAFMPLIIIGLFLLPMILIMLGLLIYTELLQGDQLDSGAMIGTLFWGISITSPHGGLLVALMDTTSDFSDIITGYPPFEAVMAIMGAETAMFLLIAYRIDISAVAHLHVVHDPTVNEEKLSALDEDVVAERRRALDDRLDVEPMTNSALIAGSSDVDSVEDGGGATPHRYTYPLRIKRLRKVFPSKSGAQGADVVATEDSAFVVEKGECFGLLGANGAGKSTTIAMCTRHLNPTAGDAFINGVSILDNFTAAAQNLGVVTQNNSLWDLLSVDQHLRLFARLRGVPGNVLDKVVSSTLDQMELRPHRYKLACRLSGGMKRKLCVAISLIGDPAVVLLDEPSAGLDPKSRRNLWDVILRTMGHRSVVLTTHSLEEAEALCGRIGIMVKGQMHALGTKQHLKNKFGGGFEIVVKLSLEAIGGGGDPVEWEKKERDLKRKGYKSGVEQATDKVLTMLQDSFPSAVLVNNNGGVLMTVGVQRADFDVGKAFILLEDNKAELGIEEYTVSQPTLEQVFIRTVNKHTPRSRKGVRGAHSKTPHSGSGGGIDADTDTDSVRLSVSGTLETHEEEEEEGDSNAAAASANDCGCQPWHLRNIAYIFTGLAILFLFLGVTGTGKYARKDHAVPIFYQIASPIGIIFMITACVGCWCMCCPCCNHKKGGMDE